MRSSRKRSPTLPALAAALCVSAGALLAAVVAGEVGASADPAPPGTHKESSPSSPIRETAATFRFTSTEKEGATFGCSLAGEAFLPCEGPKTYRDLAEGGHRFRVRATAAAGRADPTPASRRWTVDLTPPDTSLRPVPGDEPIFGFYCSLAGAAPARCTSPEEYAGLSAGKHAFRVYARDRAGNPDPAPESAAWTVVEDDAPVVTIEGAPRIEGYHEYHYFRFSADVPGSGFYCSLDDEPFVPCVSGAYRHVPYGEHAYAVYAVSPDGKRGETAVVEYESRDPNWD